MFRFTIFYFLTVSPVSNTVYYSHAHFSELRCILIYDLHQVWIIVICVDSRNIQAGVISVLHHRQIVDMGFGICLNPMSTICR